jgi:hypothetical protein
MDANPPYDAAVRHEPVETGGMLAIEDLTSDDYCDGAGESGCCGSRDYACHRGQSDAYIYHRGFPSRYDRPLWHQRHIREFFGRNIDIADLLSHPVD